MENANCLKPSLIRLGILYNGHYFGTVSQKFPWPFDQMQRLIQCLKFVGQSLISNVPMRRRNIFLPKVAALGCVLFFVTCRKSPCDGDKPSLEFSEFTYKLADAQKPQSTDTLKLFLKFTDCQGDVGIDPADSEEKNLHTRLYEFIGGEWVKFVPFNPADSNLLFVQIPASDKVKDGQRVEGIIEQPFGSLRQNSDTIRFETQLFDRAGNSSEVITTPQFIFPN